MSKPEGSNPHHKKSNDDTLVNPHLDQLCSRLEMMNAEHEASLRFNALSNVPSHGKLCENVAVCNVPYTEIIPLVSIESKNLLRKLVHASNRAKAFTSHPRIAAVFAPFVTLDHPGTISISLVNTSTKDRKLLLDQHPLGQPVMIFTNWSRSVHLNHALCLAYTVEGSAAAMGTNLGFVKILWDETFQDEAVVEKDIPSKVILIEESDPVLPNFTRSVFEGFIKKTIMSAIKQSTSVPTAVNNGKMIYGPTAPELPSPQGAGFILVQGCEGVNDSTSKLSYK